MNIYAKRGDKVIFINKNGYDHEPIDARENGLVKGETYTVDRTEVGGWHTDVYLKEFPGRGFNSVMFEDYVKEEGTTVMQITKQHLAFFEEAKSVFESNPKQETHWDEDKDLIALRYGADRDCIKIHELGGEVGFFAQMMDKSPALVMPFNYEALQWFGDEMEKQLQNNAVRGGWDGCTSEYFLRRIEMNISRLKVLQDGQKTLEPREYTRRCANIANFAMMLADNKRDPWDKPL